MGLMVLARKALSKRSEYYFWPSRDHHHHHHHNNKSHQSGGIMKSSNNSNNNVALETISQVNGGVVVSKTNEEGVVRVRVVVRKQDLKQMLTMLRGTRDDDHHDHHDYDHQPSLFLPSSKPISSVEQRLNLLRIRRHVMRLKAARKLAWYPALQSIPEEL